MTEKNIPNGEIVERMTFEYPESISGELREKIDEARAEVADAMIWAYSRLMTVLPQESESAILKYRKQLPFGYDGLIIPERAFPRNIERKLKEKDEITIKDIFETATDDACYLASIRVLAHLEMKHPGSFSKAFMVKGIYPADSNWKFHSYFIVEYKPHPNEDKFWYFAGSPANGRHYRDPLKLFEGENLSGVMNEINQEEGNIFPNGREIDDAFWRYNYQPAKFDKTGISNEFVQPRVYVVVRDSSGNCYYDYQYEKEAVFIGKKRGINL